VESGLNAIPIFGSPESYFNRPLQKLGFSLDGIRVSDFFGEVY
jgi:hypothetical protein